MSKESASVLRKQLKLVPQQVQVVWDVLLWAAADRGKICSQDEITDLLQVCTPSSYIYVHFQCCLWRCIHPDEEVAAYCMYRWGGTENRFCSAAWYMASHSMSVWEGCCAGTTACGHRIWFAW